MKGKTILITGATSGIGRQSALALARMGANIVFTTRDEEKGMVTRDFLIRNSGNEQVFPMHCRLDSLNSVREFCFAFLDNYPQLHVLINNAGILEKRRKESRDGIELTFAVNHLAPFLLTHLLLKRLIESAPARIINVSSDTHFNNHIHFDDPEYRSAYTPMAAYSQSKLANVMFTYSLAKKLSGTGVTVNCLHPGFVSTSIFRNYNPFVRIFIPFRALSPAKGAETTVFLASDEHLRDISGKYFYQKKALSSSPASLDQVAAERLWNISMKYVGLTK